MDLFEEGEPLSQFLSFHGGPYRRRISFEVKIVRLDKFPDHNLESLTDVSGLARPNILGGDIHVHWMSCHDGLKGRCARDLLPDGKLERL